MLVDSFPDKPGVYLLKDKSGNVLYVGKAKSLRDRLRAYIRSHKSEGIGDERKLGLLVSKIADVDYIVTGTEMEALLLEANLIKLHLPPYNIRLKDDKKYPYIKVTVKDAFPCVVPTRDLTDRKAIYFGPYTNVKTMKRALQSATEIFPVRVCKGNLPRRACLAYHIGRCPAPCESKISKEEYKDTVAELINFLSGKSNKVREELSAKMRELSNKLEFESAAKVRDRLRSIDFIVRKQSVVFTRPVDMDVFGLAIRRRLACVVLVCVREGRVMGTEHYILHIPSRSSNGAIMRAFLLQYYKNAFYIPPKIVVREVDERSMLEEWLTGQKTEGRCKILLPRKGSGETRLGPTLRMAEDNALVWLESESQQKVPKVLQELQKALNLTKLPVRIEAFDVSNIMGDYAVGSCVRFVGGRAQKSGYRRFKIRTVEGIDDVGMMREVLSRRAKHKNLPDLVLVDGGIGQVRVARAVFHSIPVFGLAKRLEELHTPDGKVISLPKSSIALRLLQRIRDEAHRFAISYHKKLRDEPKSILCEIPGIGEQRRRSLLSHFGSFSSLKLASISELAKVPGIGKKRAKEIYNYLRLI